MDKIVVVIESMSLINQCTDTLYKKVWYILKMLAEYILLINIDKLSAIHFFASDIARGQVGNHILFVYNENSFEFVMIDYQYNIGVI